METTFRMGSHGAAQMLTGAYGSVPEEVSVREGSICPWSPETPSRTLQRAHEGRVTTRQASYQEKQQNAHGNLKYLAGLLVTKR